MLQDGFPPPRFLLPSSSCLDVANIFRIVPIRELEKNILLSSFACVKHPSSFPPARAWFYRKDMLRVKAVFVLHSRF